MNFINLNSLGFNLNPKDCRIVVAMSGGVDSSVVAALLKHQGYDVIGVTLQLYDYSGNPTSKGTCCAGLDVYDARNVANKINIPHYVLNYESIFKDSVIKNFADEYVEGRTPIPCVKCNQTVKFNDLLKFSKELNANALATGHYVQRKIVKNSIELHKGRDNQKDQSYFLFATTLDQLDFLRFPLGGMMKTETRNLAKKFGLHVKNKPDSQDICFVPNGKYSEVVKQLRPESILPGEIVHIDGQVLAKHNGIINYTIGQRKGIGVGGRKNKPDEVLYVIEIDPQSQRVYVGPQKALQIEKIYLENINLIEKNFETTNDKVFVKLRNTGELIKSTLHFDRENTFLKLDKAVQGISPGQAAVFYDISQPSKVLGGGWITKTEKLYSLHNAGLHNVA